MFRRVLVANRGEIAVRICRTLRALGIESVVVASVPDRASLAVRTADRWVLLPGASATETYLRQDAVIAAAKAEGCDAIHPGYGFLSENADFAERCAAEGITFIGPPPGVLRGLGDKAAARHFATANGVPVVPGYDGPDDDAAMAQAANGIGYPLMVKARAGGGGRGMREVHDPAALIEALAGARREAQASFGDPGLLLERLVRGAHHVEVQVLADTHGNAVHLGERDCSLQRRRQKLVEEAPSPVVDAPLRAELTGAALRIARAAGYVNAGTFEFLVGEPGADGRRPFYFLEVNPRLQVEHPVTEAITGLDLVALQLRIAAGEPLPFAQDDVRFDGHAIEVRINAEDPWDAFRPGTGRLAHAPGDAPGWRLDRGFAKDDHIPPQYDSLIAKAIVHRATREEARHDLAAAVAVRPLRGIRGNTSLLRSVLASGAFAAGAADVGWLERDLAAVLAAGSAPDGLAAAAAAAAYLWKNPFHAGTARVSLDDGARVRTCEVTGRAGKSFHVLCEGPGHVLRLIEAGGDGQLRLGAENGRARYAVARGQAGEIVARQDEADGAGAMAAAFSFAIVPPPPLPRRARATEEGVSAITAPLAGTIATVRAAEGDTVAAGDLLLTLEAMKMEHRVTAPRDGAIARIAITAGDVVREGDLLVEMGDSDQ